MLNLFPASKAEMAQPGKARAWKVRGVMRLGSSNLPLGAILITKKNYERSEDDEMLAPSDRLDT